jgi:sodium-dependent phosphate transporter
VSNLLLKCYYSECAVAVNPWLTVLLSNSVDLFYVLFKGVARFDIEDVMSPAWAVPMCFAIGAFFGVLWIFVFGPCAKRRLEANKAKKEADAAKKVDIESANEPKADHVDGEDHEFNSFQQFLGGEPLAGVGKPIHTKEVVTAQAVATPDEPAGTEVNASLFQKFKSNTVDQDLKSQSMHESARAQEIWDNEEQFDEDAEHLFNYIQVFTASLNSFAHGANDVANTIAPMSAVIGIYMSGEASSKTGVPLWMLAYGGFAIVMGLLLYGYKVMKSLGYKLTMLSPSRGASAELGASLTSVTASFLGIPVSTTQCIVGAVTAVGLVGGRQAVDWFFLLKICSSWVALFFIAVIWSAGFFSFCFYSPGAFYPAYLVNPVLEEEE